jgi:hypothetical protein
VPPGGDSIRVRSDIAGRAPLKLLFDAIDRTYELLATRLGGAPQLGGDFGPPDSRRGGSGGSTSRGRCFRTCKRPIVHSRLTTLVVPSAGDHCPAKSHYSREHASRRWMGNVRRMPISLPTATASAEYPSHSTPAIVKTSTPCSRRPKPRAQKSSSTARRRFGAAIRGISPILTDFCGRLPGIRRSRWTRTEVSEFPIKQRTLPTRSQVCSAASLPNGGRQLPARLLPGDFWACEDH